MDTTFWPHRALLSFGIVWLGIMAWSTGANAESDFSDVSDVDLLLHEDREEAMEEYKQRTRDYTPQEVREIEEEFFRRFRKPREEVEPTVEELLAKINQADNVQRRMKSFTALHERYEVADASEKGKIREAFLAAWAEVPFPATYEEDENNNMMRYRDYAHQAGLYYPTEELLLPILVERCLNIDAADHFNLFIGELTRAKVSLGALAAKYVEQVYHDMTATRGNPIISDSEYGTLGEIHQVLGRCGKPGFDALLRMGTESSEHGIFTLQLNNAPEAEALLWKMYGETPHDHNRSRIDILRAIGSKRGPLDERVARRARIRPELVRHLQLPEGQVDLWAVQDAVELAKDTNDEYYLPHVTALESAFFRLGKARYKCSGMEDRMDEALVTLRENFEEAKTVLENAKVASLE